MVENDEKEGETKPDKSRKTLNSIEFSVIVIAIIFGIVLILMIFYQYVAYYELSQYPTHMLQTFNPTLFYPEIFIPEGIMLIALGFTLFFIFKMQIKIPIRNKTLDYLSIGLVSIIMILIFVFIVGHNILRYYHYTYEILDPQFLIISTTIVIVFSIIILNNLKRISRNEEKSPEHKEITSKQIIHKSIINFTIVTIFFLIIIINSLFIGIYFFQGSYGEHTISKNDFLISDQVVLPGMNATYHFIIESEGGSGSSTYVVIEKHKIGNWTVNMFEVEIKPNERKVITFTNQVPEDSSEKENTYIFSLIWMTDSGPKSKGSDQSLITYVTHDEDYFNFSQSSESNMTPYSYSGGPSSTFSKDLLFPFAAWLFIVWFIITIIYSKRSGI